MAVHRVYKRYHNIAKTVGGINAVNVFSFFWYEKHDKLQLSDTNAQKRRHSYRALIAVGMHDGVDIAKFFLWRKRMVWLRSAMPQHSLLNRVAHKIPQKAEKFFMTFHYLLTMHGTPPTPCVRHYNDLY